MSTVTRSKARTIAAETVHAVDAGHYTRADTVRVPIGEAVWRAVAGTVGYPPDAPLPAFSAGVHDTSFEVLNESTLDAARRLVAGGRRVVALNFASAKHPGGGFLNGAQAQEESLCRASALYACLRDNEMYARHAGLGGGFYTNSAIYSPDVPVFRTDAGDWLAEPVLCSFVTAPAVNAGVYLGGDGVKRDDVRREMRDRVAKVLAIMAGHGHDAAVLGAWGCGVFKNDPDEVAALFREALDGPFRGAFARVAFAVFDRSGDGRFIRPFVARFAG